MTELGKKVSKTRLETYLRGRIHLTDITESYKKYQNLAFEENTDRNKSNTIVDPSAEEEFDTDYYDSTYYGIIIKGDGSINWCVPWQNYLSAIAAVDYAMRETKPSCGLVKEFKIISK